MLLFLLTKPKLQDTAQCENKKTPELDPRGRQTPLLGPGLGGLTLRRNGEEGAAEKPGVAPMEACSCRMEIPGVWVSVSPKKEAMSHCSFISLLVLLWNSGCVFSIQTVLHMAFKSLLPLKE